MSELSDHVQAIIAHLEQITTPGFTWDEFYKTATDAESNAMYELPKRIKSCMRVDRPDPEDERVWYPAGSYAPKCDTPVALYRWLYLLRPSNVSFVDMYKPALFTGYSIDERFAVSFCLYKYEFGIYFYCRDKDDLTGPGSAICGGWPGCDNGQNAGSVEAKAFFRMIELATETTWRVYPGNNFNV